MTSKPRILFISTPWTYESHRARNIAKRLCELGEVDVVAINADEDKSAAAQAFMSEFSVRGHFPVEPVGKSPTSRIKRMVDPNAAHPHGLRLSPEDEARLVKRANDYDLLWFFKLRTANMFSRSSWSRAVIDVDDLPSSYYESTLSYLTGVGRLKARWERSQWRRREAQLASRFQTAVTCSRDDANRMPKSLPVHVIPNGFAKPPAVPFRLLDPGSPKLGFVGLFDHMPNALGLKWFVESCWPLIRKAVPAAKLRLMGRGSDRFAEGLAEGVEGLGWVNDAAAEMASWSGMIVPLFAGGGTRVKIAEGFARKCPVISTTVGAYGYPVEDGRELRISDSPGGFAAACVELLNSPEIGAALAERGWEAFLKSWTWDAIAPRIKEAVDGCLARN